MNEKQEQSYQPDHDDHSENVVLQRIKVDMHRQLLEVLDLNEARHIPIEKLHEECSKRVDALLNARQYPMSGPDKQRLLREVMDEVFGFGPLEVFLRDPHVSDILVNGPSKIYIEKNGRIESTKVTFMDEKHLMRIIHRIGSNVGRRIDESMP
ncbi:MAG: hypothetical protein ACYTEK_27870 [Planctomycetota bacterium]|jgi:pilus assembly protein CpaF